MQRSSGKMGNAEVYGPVVATAKIDTEIQQRIWIIIMGNFYINRVTWEILKFH